MMELRCAWCLGDEDYEAYHDTEWGVPVREDGKLFEMLVLETAQAGLSWLTILKRRENYRRAFDGFDPVKVAAYTEEKIQELLQDAGIIRNRLKIRSAVNNAKIFLQVQEEYGSFSEYLWHFVEGIPVDGGFERMEQIPVQTPLAEQVSKDMKRRGFSFVGPVSIYAYLQSVGVVNDHLVSCPRHAGVQSAKEDD